MTTTTSSGRPEGLRQRIEKGNEFDRLVAGFYLHGPDAGIRAQHVLEKDTRGRGRADLIARMEHAVDDGGGVFVVLIEAKYTDWDAMGGRGTVRRNLLRHRNQHWNYQYGRIQYQDKQGQWTELLEEVETMTLVYPWRPGTPGLTEEIEETFGEYAISVVWFDEAPPENTSAGDAWKAMHAGKFGDISVLDRPGQEPGRGRHPENEMPRSRP